MGNKEISQEKVETDLGMLANDAILNLRLLVGHTFKLWKDIWVTFHLMDEKRMKKSINAPIRLRLAYEAVVLSPEKKKG